MRGKAVVRRRGPRRSLIALDWDGVLHDAPDWRPVFGDIDLGLISEAHERGYAVAVMTCNSVPRVAAALRERGIQVVPDERMRRPGWNGGRDGREVLVTKRKVAAAAYVDDRAIHYVYGQDPSLVWEELDRRGGFLRPCLEGPHWGRLGAAGVLLYAVREGRVSVLLGQRSARVQAGKTWSGFGGAIDHGEGPWEAAKRELAEEVTGVGSYSQSAEHVNEHGCGWRYTTFLARAGLDADGLLPQARVSHGAKWETDELRWVTVEQVPALRLHPGFAASWPELRGLLEQQTAGERVVADVPPPASSPPAGRQHSARQRRHWPFRQAGS
jgi:8-oxo-dGTP diphosphatase